jgi:hypothetical protein
MCLNSKYFSDLYIIFFKIFCKDEFYFKFYNENLINLFMEDTVLCCKGMANRLQENDPK